MTAALIGGIGAITLCAVLMAVLLMGNGAAQVDQRIDKIKEQWRRSQTAGSGEATDVRRERSDSSLAFLDQIIKRFLPRPEMLRARLVQTGKRISIGEYVLASGVCGAIGWLLTSVVGGAGPVTAAGVTLFATIGVPHMVVGRMAARRKAKFTALFPEAIDLIVRGLRSGLPVTESVRVVSQEIGPPVGEEFRSVIDAIGFGETLDDAMWAVAKRIATPEFKFFVVSLSVQRETGGNLAETLENLSDVLRSRRQMKQKVKALASEPKASAIILGSLPFIMFGLIAAINWEYLSQLFTDPRGHRLIIAGLISQAIGVAVMAKMVRFEI